MWAGIIAMVIMGLGFMVAFIADPEANEVSTIPPMPSYAPSNVVSYFTRPAVSEEQEWSEYHAEAVKEYADEFTALFNAYEIKRAKNGALMIRSGNSGSYRFAKKG